MSIFKDLAEVISGRIIVTSTSSYVWDQLYFEVWLPLKDSDSDSWSGVTDFLFDDFEFSGEFILAL